MGYLVLICLLLTGCRQPLQEEVGKAQGGSQGPVDDGGGDRALDRSAPVQPDERAVSVTWVRKDASFVVEGSMTRDLVRDVVDEHMIELGYCHEMEVKPGPSLMDKVVVELEISADGRVREAEVTRSTLGSQEKEQCIIEQVKEWTFPALEEGNSTRVVLPFVFQPHTAQGGELLSAYRSVGDYSVQVHERQSWGGEDDEFAWHYRFAILRDGRELYSGESEHVPVLGHDVVDEGLVESLVDPKLAWLDPGKDLTGDGVPNLIVWTDTGGAHCCLSAEIFEVGESFRKIQTIDFEHVDVSTDFFEDLDSDGFPEIKLYDFTFAYWRAGFAGSPSPQVILKLRKGKYRIATQLMKTHAPTEDELADLVPSEPWWGDQPDPEVWGNMLDLIYSGHESDARKLLDMSWPEGTPGKHAFWKDFKKQLAKSPHAEAVSKM